MAGLIDVPQPPVKPVIGNADRMDRAAPVQSLMALARQYGPYYKLTLPGRELFVASSHELVEELCDDTRFAKRVHAPLREIRAFAGDGLFTAYNDEPNWATAHAVLMPAFGPIGVRGMFDDMVDIADQMLTRWARFGPDSVIDVADNMTRLTLDTIALTAFDYRFNSFYRDDMHPFVDAMVGALAESGARARRLKTVSDLMLLSNRRYQSDIELMRSVARDLVAARRGDIDAATRDDLLGRMLHGRDPNTGLGLSDDNIVHQMITFLIAGHETTSGLLSFAIYLLLRNPAVLNEARRQVDEVVGGETPTLEHLARLRYVEQVLMETLRLWPTAPLFARSSHEPTVIGGRFEVTPDQTVAVLIPTLHRDPAVWGADAEEFRPERFEPGRAESLPAHAWKPFGTGARACIGRPFAMQEAHLVLTMVLQRFEFALNNPGYSLRIHETLTLKPENLRIRAWPRRSAPPRRMGAVAAVAASPSVAERRPDVALPADAAALTILYGSNTGSSEAFARKLHAQAAANGFAALVGPMDDYAGGLPTDGGIVVVTASYEGQPPDNAAQFVAYAEALGRDALTGRPFAVFGCGNRQWARTWQAIPRRVEAALAGAGAEPVIPRGEADSGGDFFGAFDAWSEQLWPALADRYGTAPHDTSDEPALRVEWVETDRASVLRLGDLGLGTVVENRELVDIAVPGARSKRHLEFALPPGMTYQAGDYLAVLASNPLEQVDRALRRFALTADRSIVIDGGVGLPTGYPVGVGEILSRYVELGQPATRSQVARLAGLAACPPEKARLEALAGDDYDGDVLGKRASVLDLIEAHPSVALAFADFLAMLPPMRARQYSISSSPLWNAGHATLTVAVVDEAARSGVGRFRGVASTFASRLSPGDRVPIAVRPSQARFRPPADPLQPMVLICAGSGIAPFRGFLQDRAEMRAGGRDIGVALLYFGTNDPDVDFLYRDELERWEKMGVVSLRPVFSAKPVDGATFVQHRLWAERNEIKAAFREGAGFYVCGDGLHMAPAVRRTLIDIYREETGSAQEEANMWADSMERDHGRYVADVFV